MATPTAPPHRNSDHAQHGTAGQPSARDPLHLHGCPLLDAPTMQRQEDAVRAATRLSISLRGFLADRPLPELASWLQAATRQGRVLFQPWVMEIVYLAGILGEVRFMQLEKVLGISSRTLSNKLQTLTGEGFLDREVFDERPPKVVYTLTKRGRAAAALTAPLFAHLNLEATDGVEPPSLLAQGEESPLPPPRR